MSVLVDYAPCMAGDKRDIGSACMTDEIAAVFGQEQDAGTRVRQQSVTQRAKR